MATSAEPTNPQASLGYLFRLAFQRFRTALERQLKGLGLSAQEYGILRLFETRAELSVSELARLSQVTRQTTHAAVLVLETAGFLERRARNQRVVLVAPTKSGRARLRRGRPPGARARGCGRGGVVREWLARVATLPESRRWRTAELIQAHLGHAETPRVAAPHEA